MVSRQLVDQQLKELGFNRRGWGRAEISELPNILLPEEKIMEAVNGFYDGGFALLLATDIRVLLIDKKPLNYLTVEDLRFDMINEIDYGHRLLGAQISIASGQKRLLFRSWNQPRLRKLISHVQHAMAQIKKQQNNHQEGQNQHLREINQQLQAYLVAQQQHELDLQKLQISQQAGGPVDSQLEAVKPEPALSDYLYAQSLLADYQARTGKEVQLQPLPVATLFNGASEPREQLEAKQTAKSIRPVDSQLEEMYADGLREVFGDRNAPSAEQQITTQPTSDLSMEINPMSIAYSKLPMALRNRKFGRSLLDTNRPVPAENLAK